MVCEWDAGIGGQGPQERNETSETELEKPKGKVSTVRDFPRMKDLDGLYLCFHFDRWHCLPVELYRLNGSSIMESVVLRSQGLLRSGAQFH